MYGFLNEMTIGPFLVLTKGIDGHAFPEMELEHASIIFEKNNSFARVTGKIFIFCW